MIDYEQKYEKYTDEELVDAIDQLGAEVGMGKRTLYDELKAAQVVAEKRGVEY